MIAFANNFLAGSLITLLIPGCVFIAMTIWYARSVLRLATTRDDESGDAPAVTPSAAGSENEPPPPARP